ncbi:hypothetical protein [Catalinimonas niigatensis]|uniref:hypothetical protein n=1 Tax=Catalinimonas niigatensis TaxID=1397264 RepID=UPI002666859E|nr:hypothetical protein [Catalinimonas niigatensis]WPP51817.1 hypothetical protein PZB72_05380 [Catalinimonas niigatensis]
MQPKEELQTLILLLKAGWKLHVYYEDNGLELYNLKEDVGEKRNLAMKNPEKAKALYSLLQNWLEKTKAPISTELNPAYDAVYEKKQLELYSSE